MRRSALVLAFAAACGSPVAAPPATLLGRAVLPAGTFAAGPASGERLGSGPIHGQAVPFASQPVQGFSALLANDDGTYLGLVDNGYGKIENSADFHLRVYTLRLDLRTAAGGSGGVEVLGQIELRDPDRKIGFPIVQQFSDARVLTGADFDPESMQRAPDGTLWFGDEFGPFLLHTAADGVVLEPPIGLPDLDRPGLELRAPQNPNNEEGAALRLMNAVAWRGRQRGAIRPPVFSPHHAMVKDEAPGEDGRELFAIDSLRAAGFPVVVWTVNEVARMHALMRLGVDGIISDRPDLLYQAARSFDGDGDGVSDFVDADGLVRRERIDLQGHRGARDLRPENTLPAMEAALDQLMTTLETDVVLTADDVPVLGHDLELDARKCRDVEGGARRVRALTIAALQRRFVCDGLVRGAEQANDRTLSPVVVAFASAEGLADPYTPPTLAQWLGFVAAYGDYYAAGPGAGHPEAARRAANARRVRLSVETKLTPDDPFAAVFAERVSAAIVAAGATERAWVQSFDYRTLLQVQDRAPALGTVFLLADGTNLPVLGGAPSRWLAGLGWPHGVTARTQPLAVATSGGFEGMALRSSPPALLPILEKPIVGAPAGEVWIHEYDLSQRTYTERRWRHRLEAGAVAVTDFQLDADGRGFVIERDDSEGELGDAFKKVVRTITLAAPGATVEAGARVDLLRIADPHSLAPASAGDVGVGGGVFAMPFVTIESLVLLPQGRMLVGNDNNLPFSVGRHRGDGRPDDQEFVLLQVSPR
ncbi:esterase-like activity of phytase family protein [Nannocystis bainbridge]|uniref:Esterase-like activity of phytase family protein n=1 Tax=Nannocystis bainbridge TaxID=2995303 RepID=A0ABT5E4E6_9BACT|nr:esterase-like activity of phytase family protein [Nannocystis bainbridge]MDC0720313.1 esterase-like activity of phytase family protein [Nannocystis bainbridge]